MPIRKSTKSALFILLTLVLTNSGCQAADASVGTEESAKIATRLAGPFTNAPADQVLARVGEHSIRAIDLEQALASSPVSTSFVSMNEDDQARVRGDMLQRLITAELIHLEALASGIPSGDAYLREMAAYRTGLLAQAYMSRLRDEIAPPAEVMADINQRFRGDADAKEAAKASYVAQRYPELKAQRMAELHKQFKLKQYPQRVLADATSDTVVAEGDGIVIHLGNLQGGLDALAANANVELLKRRLEESADTVLLARAAEAAGIDVSGGLERYGHDLASRLLLRERQRAWVPDEAAKRAWFQKHPDVGEIPTRWHVGQVVLKTKSEAEQVLARINAGESLFTIAGDLSIDPYGREHNGDMGWLHAGQGVAQLEKTLDALEDGAISKIIETPLGFHILTVLERRPGSQKTYEDVHDRVEQAMIATQLPDFLVGLEKKYGVTLDPETVE